MSEFDELYTERQLPFSRLQTPGGALRGPYRERGASPLVDFLSEHIGEIPPEVIAGFLWKLAKLRKNQPGIQLAKYELSRSIQSGNEWYLVDQAGRRLEGPFPSQEATDERSRRRSFEFGQTLDENLERHREFQPMDRPATAPR